MSILFSDNFNRANTSTLSGYVKDAGSWNISSNHLVTGTAGDVIYRATAPLSADYSVSANFYTTSTSTGGVCARRTAANTMYLAQFQGSPANIFQLYKQVAGTWIQFGTNLTVTPVGGVENIKITVNGSSIKAYFNGVEKIAVTDTAITAAGYGGMRFGNMTSTWYFDDFLIETLPNGTLDRQNIAPLTGGNGIKYGPTIDIEGFSFRPQQTGTLNELNLSFGKVGSPTGNYFLQLYSSSASNRPINLIATSNTVSAANIQTVWTGEFSSWSGLVFPFSSSPTVTAGEYYFVVVNGSMTPDTGNYGFICSGSSGDTDQGELLTKGTSGDWYPPGGSTKYWPWFKEYITVGGGDPPPTTALKDMIGGMGMIPFPR